MKLVIIAGGKGERLRNVINRIPKPMAPVAGKPFLEYLILYFIKYGFTEIVLSVGFKGNVIRKYFGNGDHWGIQIDYSEESTPLGTGGALKRAFSMVDDDMFIAINGDSFLEVDLYKMVAFHKLKKSSVTMGLAFINDISRYGRVYINEREEIQSIAEKDSSGSGLINGGVYLLNSNVINMISDGNVSLEKELFPKMIGKGLYGIETRGFFIDIGIPKDYCNLRDNPQKFISKINKKVVYHNSD